MYSPNTSAFVFIYAHSKLMVDGNATATANKIAASGMLFRRGIAGKLKPGFGFM